MDAQQVTAPIIVEVEKQGFSNVKVIQVSKNIAVRVLNYDSALRPLSIVSVLTNGVADEDLVFHNPERLQTFLDDLAYLMMEVDDFKNGYTFPQAKTVTVESQEVITQNELIAVSKPEINLELDNEEEGLILPVEKSEAETLLEGLCG